MEGPQEAVGSWKAKRSKRIGKGQKSLEVVVRFCGQRASLRS